MRIENKPMFLADDGKIFEKQIDCENYEKTLAKEAEKTTYWRVLFKPDLNEGRGYYGLKLIRCYGTDYKNQAKDLMEDWCYRTIGRPVAYVQGCSPMRNWCLMEIDREKFSDRTSCCSVGDYSYQAEFVYLKVGEREEGLVLGDI